MIIIITGASHTGKTVLAQRMLEKYKYPYLSIDHLKMGLIRSGNTDLTPEDDEELTRYLWPIVREIIKTAIENEQNLVVEGCYVPFKWRQDFEDQYLKSIRFICLAMSDDYIRNNWDDITGHASEIESRIKDMTKVLEHRLTPGTRGVSFMELLPEEPDRYDMTLSFMSLLSMIKNQGYDAEQHENFGEIKVIKKETADVQQ